MKADPIELHRVPFDGTFRVADTPTTPPDGAPLKREAREELQDCVTALRELQHVLFAHDHHSVLLIFQGMDAAGKDGTIRAVMSGLNPAGCQVFSFKRPSAEELDHDFLWRTACRLPERGRIGIFNRSYYEEVLVVRVHPEILDTQNIPGVAANERLWEERYESIRDHERHLARNGTLVLKFFLHVSREEQKERFLARLDRPEKNWKFSAQDVVERQRWPEYQQAFEGALNATSRTWAPWWAIPADHKPYMRFAVARILVDALRGLDLRYPEPSAGDRARFSEMRDLLEGEA